MLKKDTVRSILLQVQQFISKLDFAIFDDSVHILFFFSLSCSQVQWQADKILGVKGKKTHGLYGERRFKKTGYVFKYN